MKTHRIDGVIGKLGDSADLQKVIEQTGLAADRVLEMLRTPYGKKQLKAFRILSRVHSRLLADRYSPYAVHRLVELLQNEKFDLRLKSADLLLQLSGIASKAAARAIARRPETPPAAPPPPAVPELSGTETAELLEAVAEVLTRWRKEKE
jgi:hypothetical protein